MFLPWLIIIPFIGGFFCWLVEFFHIKLPRWIAIISMILTLVISLQSWIKLYYFCNNEINVNQWQSEFFVKWIPRFGINFHLAIDGLSILMIMLTSLLGLMAVLCSWNEIKKYQGFFYLNLMWIISGVMGVFISIDLFLFFFFWEMMLIPMYFLIALWGHNTSNKKTCIFAATKFFIYTQSSGLLMLVGIIGLVFIHYNTTSILTFDYTSLINTKISYKIEYILMLCFFVAFAVKIPIVPLHGWLPDAHSQAPTAGSVDLAGILLKTAAYGLLRFNQTLFPNASLDFAPIVMFLGLVNIFYGAWAAMLQTDVKRLIAYTSISHMGFILIAIYSQNKLALQGSIIQMIAHGLSASGLFILCGQLYERLKTRDIRKMGGLWKKMKWIPGFSLFFAIANLGMPGTGNFIGEFMILIGSFNVAPLVIILSTFSLVYASIYSLVMIQSIYYGKLKINQFISNISKREFLIMISLTILSILLGMYPKPILDTSYNSIGTI